MFWAVFFFLARHMTSSDRTLLVQFLTPLGLRDKYNDLLAYSNKQFNRNKTWFTDMVKKYGKVYLDSESGKAWLAYRAEADKHPDTIAGKYVGESTEHIKGPETVGDLFHFDVDADKENPDPTYTGLHWTRYNAIDFYKKFLLLVETEPTGDERLVGWLDNDPDNFWLNALSQVALEAILFYVQHEGPHGNSLKQGALGTFLAQSGFEFDGETVPRHNTRKIPSEVYSDNASYEYYEAYGKNNLGSNLAMYTDEALDAQPSEADSSDPEFDEEELEDSKEPGMEEASASQLRAVFGLRGEPGMRKTVSRREDIGLGTADEPYILVPRAPTQVVVEPLSLEEIMDGELGLGMENDDAWTAEGGLAALISTVADEESTMLANNLGERMEDAGLTYTRQQIFIKSVTVPEVMVPYARETGKLLANSNIFGQYALLFAKSLPISRA